VSEQAAGYLWQGDGQQTTVAAQESAIRAYAAQNNMEVVWWFQDGSESKNPKQGRESVIKDALSDIFRVIFCCDDPWPLILEVRLDDDLEKLRTKGVELKSTSGISIPWDIRGRIADAIEATYSALIREAALSGPVPPITPEELHNRLRNRIHRHAKHEVTSFFGRMPSAEQDRLLSKYTWPFPPPSQDAG